jgi:predicted TIM-barrel fold metal-dependent hydrolase
LLAAVLSCLTIIGGCDWVGGSFDQQPQDIGALSPAARELIDRSLSDLNPQRLTDYHAHIVGLNPETIGTFVNESWQSVFHPVGYTRFIVYKSASGITDNNDIDRQFLSRLNDLVDYLPYKGRTGIMAFDYFHDEQGNIQKHLSTFHVPDQYVLDIVKDHPDRYFPILSVHPYRKDALQRLDEHARAGVRFIKWLPNAMGINPSPDDPRLRKRLVDYYQAMINNGMILITHTGDEKATEAEDYQHLGNPLYLKLPLDMGLKVVMAHIGSLGECKPEDKSVCAVGTPYLDLAIQMMRKEEYRNILFADISALTQFNRLHALDTVIGASDIHSNLINGSDYPLPAVNFVIQTRALVSSGHITEDERTLINEIYDVNPLLFDYVLKRTIRHSKNGQRFPPKIFIHNEKLLPDLQTGAQVPPSRDDHTSIHDRCKPHGTALAYGPEYYTTGSQRLYSAHVRT